MTTDPLMGMDLRDAHGTLTGHLGCSGGLEGVKVTDQQYTSDGSGLVTLVKRLTADEAREYAAMLVIAAERHERLQRGGVSAAERILKNLEVTG